MLSIMTDDENNPEHAENVGLFYLRRIDARLDSIERKLDEAVMRLAAVERDVAAMRVRLNNLDSRVARIEGRVDLQREIARLAAELEPNSPSAHVAMSVPFDILQLGWPPATRR